MKPPPQLESAHHQTSRHNHHNKKPASGQTEGGRIDVPGAGGDRGMRAEYEVLFGSWAIRRS